MTTAPIKRAWLFGSFSRNEETPESDVDLLVEFDHSKPVGMRYFKMINDLETICLRKVDLVGIDMLDPRVMPSVYRDRILIYER